MFCALISFYQRFISPLFGQCCRFYPSCSEYSKQIYEFCNPLTATLKTAQRILSCNQLFSGGISYPKVALKLRPNCTKPCEIAYWLVPSSNFVARNTFKKSACMQKHTYFIVKNYKKVSRV